MYVGETELSVMEGLGVHRADAPARHGLERDAQIVLVYLTEGDVLILGSHLLFL